MSTIDYDAEYNNRARVPEHPGLIQGWVSDAAAYRAQCPPTELRYGSGERHTIDLFKAADGPLMLFIHGGYWQALDKSFFSHMARGLNQNGRSVAVMSYDLCPHVRIGDIIEQTRDACRALWRETGAKIVVSGHSAGGHLAACMLATDWRDLGADPVPAAYAISGLFDLAPLVPTSLNAALVLSADEAERLSPLYWPPPAGKTLDAIVGETESGEFHRQAHAIVDQWGAAGVATAYAEIAGANHFTILAPLADPNSAMCARLKALTEAAR
jgi:arylformamidase